MDSTYAVAISALLVAAALATIITSWRSLLPRKAWEDPSIVGVNRLATHSRLGNYRSFDDAAARGRSPNVVSLRWGGGYGRGVSPHFDGRKLEILPLQPLVP